MQFVSEGDINLSLQSHFGIDLLTYLFHVNF